ncbi:hypothetical protein M3J09_012011 [Ascochyta lentis]
MTSKTRECHVRTITSHSEKPIVVIDGSGASSGLLGATIGFPDGSRWRLRSALTGRKYQQGEPPFECRQVFECVCVCDPGNLYSEAKSAIIKVKYQVEGLEESLWFYAHYISECRKALFGDCGSVSHKRKLEDLEKVEELCYPATHPVVIPHQYTSNEIIALWRLCKTSCVHSPQFMNNAMDCLMSGIDTQGMVGGFVVFILMTKVPGVQLSREILQSKTIEERNVIRKAFKTALLELWKRRIEPEDCALRNLMWDDEQRKCYIVDFEDWSNLKTPLAKKYWEDSFWGDWGLSEELGLN